MAKRQLRIAATADLHYGKHSQGTLHEAFAEISGIADILLLCGDLTDYGLPEEAEALVADIRAAVTIPMPAVLGNHDFESGQAELVCKVLDNAGVIVLDGEAIEVAGVGFAGIAGFGGGFGRRMLNAWGEPLIKQFVQESISHAVRLEQALAKLQTERRIVVLHYISYPCHPKRGTSRNFCLPWFQPTRRTDQPVSRQRCVPRPRPQRHSRRKDFNRYSRLQRLRARASQNRQALSNCRVVAALYERRQRRARYAKLSRSQRAIPLHQRGFVSVKCTGRLSMNQKPLEKTALQLSGPAGAVFAPTSSYKASLSVA